MATTNLNITPYRELAREEAKSVSSIYSLTGDIRFVRAARQANKGRMMVR